MITAIVWATLATAIAVPSAYYLLRFGFVGFLLILAIWALCLMLIDFAYDAAHVQDDGATTGVIGRVDNAGAWHPLRCRGPDGAEADCVLRIDPAQLDRIERMLCALGYVPTEVYRVQTQDEAPQTRGLYANEIDPAAFEGCSQ